MVKKQDRVQWVYAAENNEELSRCYDQFVGDTERWTPAGRRLLIARRRSGRAKRTGSDWNPFQQ